MRNVLGWLAGSTLLLASPLAAQDNRAWPERTFVTIDVAFQPLNNDFSESLSFADTLRKSENVTFVAGYDSTRGAVFDVGAGVRLANHVGVGLTTSWFQHSGSGAFDLKVPNPLAANKPLDLTSTVSGLKRNELGIHLQALYGVALGQRARVLLAGGPSIFETRQDLVRSIEFDTLPGFTSLKFDQALITEVKKTVVGFNVGVDFTWALASHLGVGTVTRYSRAKLTLDPGAESGVSRAIELHAGGLQVGGGIRLLF
jgi:opacity protein-like surface antigen